MGFEPTIDSYAAHAVRRRRARRAGAALRWCRGVLLSLGCLWVALWSAGAAAQPTPSPLHLTTLHAERSDDGVWVSFDLDLRLPAVVEEALRKGVPLYFVADVSLVRYRWYWSDKIVAQSSRTWRLSYQPLTQEWRVRFGALSQSYDSLNAALRVMTHGMRWKLAEAREVPSVEDCHIEFQYRLDTDELPRPLQIGLHDQVEWNLSVQRDAPLVNAGAAGAPTP